MSNTWNHTDFHDLSWKMNIMQVLSKGASGVDRLIGNPISIASVSLPRRFFQSLFGHSRQAGKRAPNVLCHSCFSIFTKSWTVFRLGMRYWPLLTSLVVWACPSPNTCEAGKVEGFPDGPVGGRSVEVGPVDGCRWFVWKIGDFFKMEFQFFFLNFCYILNSKHHLTFEHGQDMGLGSMFRLGEMDADGNTLARCWCPAMRSRWPDFGRKDLRSHLV